MGRCSATPAAARGAGSDLFLCTRRLVRGLVATGGGAGVVGPFDADPCDYFGSARPRRPPSA